MDGLPHYYFLLLDIFNNFIVFILFAVILELSYHLPLGLLSHELQGTSRNFKELQGTLQMDKSPVLISHGDFSGTFVPGIPFTSAFLPFHYGHFWDFLG